MRSWTKLGATLAGSMAASTVGAVAVGTILWNRATARSVGQLGPRGPRVRGRAGDSADPEDGHDNSTPTRFSQVELVGLPAPVVRYFTFALTPGQPLVRRARLRSKGEFLTRPGGTWSPFTATQHFAVHPPGFVWDASIRTAPLLPVRVRDSYLRGIGTTHGRLAALVPVADTSTTPEINAAALQRYLAEAIWVPTALLPSAGVTWTPLDDSIARATLVDRDVSASVDFFFDAQGAVVGAMAERYRDLGGRMVLTQWATRSWAYERVDGMMVPTAAEVQWELADRDLPYWRGKIVDFSYEYATRS